MLWRNQKCLVLDSMCGAFQIRNKHDAQQVKAGSPIESEGVETFCSTFLLPGHHRNQYVFPNIQALARYAVDRHHAANSRSSVRRFGGLNCLF